MKPIALVPPALAILVSGIWISTQRHSIAGLDQQNDLLAINIAKVRSMARTDEDTLAQPTGTDPATAKKAIDWKNIAAQLAAARNNGGAGDMRSMRQLQQQLKAMSEQELLQALDEIAALDLPDESRMELESRVAESLAEKAPGTYLARFIDRLEDSRNQMSWRLSRGLENWAKKDPAAAIEWFDRQIAAGTFNSKSLDGKSRSRLQFEGSLITALLSSDPEAAASRLAALPPEQRKEAFHYGRSLSALSAEAGAPAFAELVRKQLPQEDQAKAIAEAAPMNISGDYGKISDYLNQISATSAERDVCVEQAGSNLVIYLSFQRKLKQEDFDRLREWTAKEAPAMSDRTTGKALAHVLSNNRMEFREAADMAQHYHENGGGDEVLLPLLETWRASQNKEVARKLAERISDEKRREEILEKLN
jgi:hypothetical protein